MGFGREVVSIAPKRADKDWWKANKVSEWGDPIKIGESREDD